MHSYDNFISHKIVVTKTLRWRLRTTGAKEVLRREPVRTLAQDSRTELSESAKLCRIDLGGSIRTLLLLGLLVAIQPGVADPRLGSWTLISAQSSLDPPNRLSITTLIDGGH